MSDLNFSIVTVSFNSEKTIATTIESVLNQTYNNFEYIIIDGKSGDNTLSIIDSYKDKFIAKGVPLIVVSESDNGIYDAMNKGIMLAKGDFVGLVNSDDFYELDALASVNDFYAENNFDVMFADLKIFDNNSSFIKKASFDGKFKKRHWNHPTMFVRRSIYDVRKYACQTIFDDLDFMLWLVAHKKEYKILTLAKTISNFRRGGVSGEKSWRQSMQRVKLANQIFKQNGMKGYKLENFLTEVAKFVL